MTQEATVKLHTAKIRALADAVEAFVRDNQTSSAMGVVEQMTKEVEALRYSTWHTYHTSGRPVK